MIDIKELNIGNYLRVAKEGLCIKKGTIIKINGIDAENKFIKKGLVGAISCHPLDEDQLDGGIWLAYLDPIEITPEILEKNGCFYPKGSMWMKLDNPYRELWICKHTDGTYWLYSSGDCDKDENFAEIRYVHQLQNALTLCGISKEIKL